MVDTSFVPADYFDALYTSLDTPAQPNVALSAAAASARRVVQPLPPQPRGPVQTSRQAGEQGWRLKQNLDPSSTDDPQSAFVARAPFKPRALAHLWEGR